MPTTWDEQGNPIKPTRMWDEDGNEIGTASPIEEAPPAAPAPTMNMSTGHPAVRLATGAMKGMASTIDPRPVIDLAKRAWNEPVATGKAVVTGIPAALRHILDQVTSGDPEQIGEAFGGGLMSAIPFTGAVRDLGVAERLANAVGISRAGRARNIVRAVSGDKALVPTIERLEPDINLPVAATSEGLRGKVAGQIAAEEPALDAAKAGLVNVPDIPIQSITDHLKATTPGQALVRQGPTGVVVKTASGNRTLTRAAERRVGELEDLAGYEQTLPAPVVQRMKQEAQDAAESAYTKTLPGQSAGVATTVSEMEASALRKALSDMGLPETDALEKSNAIMHRLMTLRRPLEIEHARHASAPALSRASEALGGRAAIPLMLGGGGAAAFAGGMSMSPVGALTGLGLAKLLQSPAWHTVSAATKRRLIPYLERGDISRFQQELMKAGSVTERLADAERERNARLMGSIE